MTARRVGRPARRESHRDVFLRIAEDAVVMGKPRRWSSESPTACGYRVQEYLAPPAGATRVIVTPRGAGWSFFARHLPDQSGEGPLANLGRTRPPGQPDFVELYGEAATERLHAVIASVAARLGRIETALVEPSSASP